MIIESAIPLAPVVDVGHGREWWAEEAARIGSDWPSVVDGAVDSMVEAGLIEPTEDEAGATPWDALGWRLAAAEYHRDRDGRRFAVEIEPKHLARLRRLMASDISVDRAWHELHAMRPRGDCREQ
jgi:hypothetical protein